MKLNQAAAALGKKGGEAGRGKAKSRTTEQARTAALTRWQKAYLESDKPLDDIGLISRHKNIKERRENTH